jgi:hypothetical protein
MVNCYSGLIGLFICLAEYNTRICSSVAVVKFCCNVPGLRSTAYERFNTTLNHECAAIRAAKDTSTRGMGVWVPAGPVESSRVGSYPINKIEAKLAAIF